MALAGGCSLCDDLDEEGEQLVKAHQKHGHRATRDVVKNTRRSITSSWLHELPDVHQESTHASDDVSDNESTQGSSQMDGEHHRMLLTQRGFSLSASSKDPVVKEDTWTDHMTQASEDDESSSYRLSCRGRDLEHSDTGAGVWEWLGCIPDDRGDCSTAGSEEYGRGHSNGHYEDKDGQENGYVMAAEDSQLSEHGSVEPSGWNLNCSCCRRATGNTDATDEQEATFAAEDETASQGSSCESTVPSDLKQYEACRQDDPLDSWYSLEPTPGWNGTDLLNGCVRLSHLPPVVIHPDGSTEAMSTIASI